MTEDPKRGEDKLIAQLGHEVHEFASLLRALETSEDAVDLWHSVYGHVVLPRGMTKAAVAATGDILSVKHSAAVLVAQELARRLALLDGTSVVEVLDAAEQRLVDASRRAVEDE